ncbi:MAG: beta-lactamase protein [Gammaproteobacteria bacterium]|nr:beta-lactamase protein [Gammaproteobacteria bacterium]
MAETKQPLNAQMIHAGDGIEQAERHLAAGRPLQTLHLAEAALAADPNCTGALRMKVEATEYLLKHNNRENFSEVRWLEGEVCTLRGALAQVSA